jgi:hypothetical protein
MMDQVLGVMKLSDPSSGLALVEEFEWQGRKWDMGYVDVWNGWNGMEWSTEAAAEEEDESE